MLLHDRYDIERPLSAGGGGQSWLARDTRTGKRVVVKALFAPVQGDDPPAQARILQQLDHPQVQRFVEGFVEEDRMVRRLHLVTEWVEGQSLDELARSRRLEQSEVDDLIGVDCLCVRCYWKIKYDRDIGAASDTGAASSAA